MAFTKLLQVNLALLSLNVAHSLDHAFNQEQGAAGFGFIGALGIFVVLVALVLSATGAQVAALATAIVGFGQTVGFMLIHIAPDWGSLSDPYYDSTSVNTLSWVILAISLGVSVYAGVVGLREWRRQAAAVAPSA